nr:kirola-like [Ipomoea batatas]
MGLKGKVLGQVEISFHGDVFHEIFRERPHHVPSMCSTILGVEGQWGTVGSVIIWKISHDGKTKTVEDVIEAIDDEKKLVKFRVIGGDLKESYKSFIITCHVDSNGDDNFVTWALECIDDTWRTCRPRSQHVSLEFPINTTRCNNKGNLFGNSHIIANNSGISDSNPVLFLSLVLCTNG